MVKRDELTSGGADVPPAVPPKELDRLNGLPLEEFTKARNKLAGDLRSKGEREAADWVAGLAKPTTAAWAVNQVMRTQRKDARALLAAGERLRKAHEDAAAGTGSGRQLRDAAAAERAAVERLSGAARGLLNASGRGLSENILERVAQTLHAISADSETRPLARAGRLSRERQATGAGPLATAPATGTRRPGRASARRTNEARLRKVRERLQRAQRDARALRSARTRAARATSDAERALAGARDQMRLADRRVTEKEAEIEKLRRELERLQ
jgi:hypothetical protein